MNKIILAKNHKICGERPGGVFGRISDDFAGGISWKILGEIPEEVSGEISKGFAEDILMFLNGFTGEIHKETAIQINKGISLTPLWIVNENYEKLSEGILKITWRHLYINS